MSKLTALFGRANYIFQTEGLVPLLKRGFSFVVRCFFMHENYYLYEHATDNIRYLNEADLMPRVDDFTLKIVSTNQEADELKAEGLEFRLQIISARQKLNKGAIAFCIFVRRELAHIGWVAMIEEARRAVDTVPYRVDFSDGQACTGGTETMQKYRGKGLMTYGYFKRFQYIGGRGVRISRNAVDTNNIASQKVHAKFNPRIYAQARYLRILRWEFWKETPLTQNGHC